jgi:hypothetical protein
MRRPARAPGRSPADRSSIGIRPRAPRRSPGNRTSRLHRKYNTGRFECGLRVGHDFTAHQIPQQRQPPGRERGRQQHHRTPARLDFAQHHVHHRPEHRHRHRGREERHRLHGQFQRSGEWLVSVYPKGNSGQEYRLIDFNGGAPFSVALDAQQNLYVMYDTNDSGGAAVNEYAPGAKTGAKTGTSLNACSSVPKPRSTSRAMSSPWCKWNRRFSCSRRDRPLRRRRSPSRTAASPLRYRSARRARRSSPAIRRTTRRCRSHIPPVRSTASSTAASKTGPVRR